MGIFKAVKGSISGVLADQWLEVYDCDAIPQGVFAQKAAKRVGANSANTKGSEDLISDGSVMIVHEGQCALVLEQGKVIAMWDQPGEHIFHSNRSPSIFSGRGLHGVGRSIMDRIGYGGDCFVRQTVIYVNTKEQMQFPFLVTCPIELQHPSTGLRMTASAVVKGRMSCKITDVATFYRTVCGGFDGTVFLSSLQPQIQAECRTVLMTALSRLCSEGITPSALPEKTDALCETITKSLTEQGISRRGFSIVSMAVESIHAADSDYRSFQGVQRDSILRNPEMAAATLAGAQADAMQAASRNSGSSITGIVAGAPASGGEEASALWYCPVCKCFRTTPFCSDCGTKRQA